ncbi:MAG: folate-binding protein YgfZ [Burkholderiales bacterium]|nr:folate-binding protein YgfZ [Burkholderiales bacterium]
MNLLATELSNLGFLRVSGADAAEFLQNLTSNDVRHLDDSTAQHSSLCSPKGRMLASFLLFRMGGDYILLLPAEMVEKVKKRLSMYILRSKVSIEEATLAATGVSGTGFPQGLPEKRLEVGKTSSGIAIRLSESRILFVSESGEGSAENKTFGTADLPYWERLEILEGIPTIFPETEGLFVPQMVNFELIGGVSFQKGCYPGQEVVTRTHFLGKVKRRMVLAHVDSAIPPSPGEEIYCGEDATGTVARCAADPRGGHDLLAVIQMENREGDLHLKSGDKLTLLQMPYSLP